MRPVSGVYEPLEMSAFGENFRFGALAQLLPVVTKKIRGIAFMRALEDVNRGCRKSEYDVTIEACSPHRDEIVWVGGHPFEPVLDNWPRIVI